MAEFIRCDTGTLTMLCAIALIAGATCGLLLYSIVSFRKGPSDGPASFVRHTTIEVLWAMIPILILIGTATPSVWALVNAKDKCGSILEDRHLR